MKKQKRVKKYDWCFGFLGFLGFMGFLINFDGTQATTFFLFFAFFGFFGSFWEYKLQQGIEDERLTENRLKASSIAFRVSLSIIWIGTVLINVLIPRLVPVMKNIECRYSFVMVLIAFGFAIGIILQPMLSYRYDTKE